MHTSTTGEARSLAPIALVAALTLGASSVAHAQWTVTYLHPAGTESSRCHSTQGGVQAGLIFIDGNFRAAYWTGTAASVVDLNPTGAFQSEGWGALGGLQVGSTYIAALGPITRAVIWNGAPNSWTDLHPTGASYSSILDLDATHQAGIVFIGNDRRASLWSGTAASWVNLHPAGTTESEARRVDSGQQVGWVRISGLRRASLWSGTAASWVNLHPPTSFFSEASGVHNGRQVGLATVGGPQHACMWTGTPESFVDLHPAGVDRSEAYSIYNNHQVGMVVIDDEWRAALWSDTPESWEDLAAELTGNWNESVAEDVWDDGETLYVAGWGFNVDNDRREALLWTRPLTPAPTCAGDVNGDGFTNAADFVILSSNFGSAVTPNTNGDLNGDGLVNSADFVILAGDFGC